MLCQRRTKDLGTDEWRTVTGLGGREIVGGDQSFGDKIPGMRSDKWIETPLPSSPTLPNVSGKIVLLFRLKTSGSSLQWVGVRFPGLAWVVQGPSMKR